MVYSRNDLKLDYDYCFRRVGGRRGRGKVNFFGGTGCA